MPVMIFRFQIGVVRRIFVFNGFQGYSTATTRRKAVPVQPRGSPILVDYLVNSIGLTKKEAVSATKKVRKTSNGEPDSVVTFFKELGLNKIQIRSTFLKSPWLLAYNVEKTNVRELQELGMSGSDLTKLLITYRFIVRKGISKTSIEYLRNLLGSNENVVKAIKRFGFVLDASATAVIESNVQLLQNQGLSKEFVARMLGKYPRCFVQKPEKFVEALDMVENELGIPRDSKMFYYGVIATVSTSKKIMDLKMEVLRSFGFSDLCINGMIKKHPGILGTSVGKLRKMWNFFTKEVGYKPEFLASCPNIFNLSFEKRVLPRYQVLKFVNEKQMNEKKRFNFYSVLCWSELDFINRAVLPYKDEIPADVVDSYFKVVGKKKYLKLFQ